MATGFIIELQKANYWCWAAVSVSIHKYFFPTSKFTQSQVAAALFGKADNDQPANVSQGLNALNQKALRAAAPRSRKRPAPAQPAKPAPLKLTSVPAGRPAFEVVEAALGKCLPVCVLIGGTKAVGHYVVIRGCSRSAAGEKILDIADPIFKYTTIPYNDFPEHYRRPGKWVATAVVSA